MKRISAAQIKTPALKYKLTHPLIGKDCRFDTWLSLVNHVVDVAENEAKNKLYDQLIKLTTEISDEILETFEEYIDE